jgi:hypothetical protein
MAAVVKETSRNKVAVQRILDASRNDPMLMIGEMRLFPDCSGIIELVLEDHKFRFQINAGPARRGLRVRLRLARPVKGNWRA